MRKTKFARFTPCILLLTLSVALPVMAGDETAERLASAKDVFNTLKESGHGIKPEQIAAADCIAVIPGFKKGAVVVGVGFGRGFISCKKNGGWSAPAAVALESGSLGVQVGGEKIDIVILSLDKNHRAKLLSDRFSFGSDASAAWGNGKSAHDDPSAKIIFYGHTKGVFGGFGLDGATLKPDEAGNKALYGKAMTNAEIVDKGTNAPEVAQPLLAALGR